MRCECGEEVSGEVCMLCGSEVPQDAGPEQDAKAGHHAEQDAKPDAPVAHHAEPDVAVQEDSVRNNAAEPGRDSSRTGRLGDYMLDITESIRIMDKNGNQIYDIPFGGVKCSNRLGVLHIQYPGGSVCMRGSGGRAWRRAISYQQSPPVWYLKGAEDCEVSYGDLVLGVTPCIAVPPFSWDAFHRGSYELHLSRPGAEPKRRTIRAVSGTHTIRFPDGEAARRAGDRPEGDILVLNDARSLVLSDVPYLTDQQGITVLSMPDATVSIGFLKRGATISWNEPGLGQLSVRIRCDAGLKYDRLREMLPPTKPKTTGSTATKPQTTKPQDVAAQQHAEPQRTQPQEAIPEAVPDTEPYTEPYTELDTQPYHIPKPAPKRRWWSWRRKPNRYNRGNYQGTDLCVTRNDLDTRLGRLDGYAFESVCSNLLAAAGYEIVKGYDAESGRMIGPTRFDKGIDVIAVKGKERVIVQCKLWREQTGGPDVNKTLGAATTEGGTSILMISTGGFTQQARQIARESSMKVELWDWDIIQQNIRRHLL